MKCHLLKHSNEGEGGPLSRQYALCLDREEAFTRRWKPMPALEDAERKVVFDEKFKGQSNKQGLGFHKVYKHVLSKKEQREKVVEAIKLDHKQTAAIHTMGLALQGSVSKWGEDVQPFNLSWHKLISTKFPKVISHILNSYINCLPTPNNLKRWQSIKDESCPLCNAPQCTLMHILSMCTVALEQRRYSWRHDSVLNTLQPELLKHIESWNESKEVKSNKIIFVKAGERKAKTKSGSTPDHLLRSSHDWKFQIDFRDKPVIFPVEICPSALRPDIVIWSINTHFAILIELTCPAEENIHDAKLRKETRYAELLTQIESAGWSTKLFTVEAGVRGCLSKTFLSTLRKLGFSPRLAKSVCSKVSDVVSRCSYSIFQAYKGKLWTDPPLLS